MYFPLISQVLNPCIEIWASVRHNWEAEQANGQKRAWLSIWCNQVAELKKFVVQQTSWDPLVTHSPRRAQRYPKMQARQVPVRGVSARHSWMDGAWCKLQIWLLLLLFSLILWEFCSFTGLEFHCVFVAPLHPNYSHLRISWSHSVVENDCDKSVLSCGGCNRASCPIPEIPLESRAPDSFILLLVSKYACTCWNLFHTYKQILILKRL